MHHQKLPVKNIVFLEKRDIFSVWLNVGSLDYDTLFFFCVGFIMNSMGAFLLSAGTKGSLLILSFISKIF